MNWRLLREGLRRARNTKGLTLNGAAAATSLNRATIHSIENVKREPHLKPELETIESLVTAYNMTLGDFFSDLENVSEKGTMPSLLKVEPVTDHEQSSAVLTLSQKATHAAALQPIVFQFTERQFEQLLRVGVRAATDAARPKPATKTRPQQSRRRRHSAKGA